MKATALIILLGIIFTIQILRMLSKARVHRYFPIWDTIVAAIACTSLCVAGYFTETSDLWLGIGNFVLFMGLTITTGHCYRLWKRRASKNQAEHQKIDRSIDGAHV